MNARLMPMLALALAGAVGATAGCLSATEDERAREYMPHTDMVRGPTYKAFAPNLVTQTGYTLQRPVAGTIARGQHPFHYGPGEEEAERAGRELRYGRMLVTARADVPLDPFMARARRLCWVSNTFAAPPEIEYRTETP